MGKEYRMNTIVSFEAFQAEAGRRDAAYDFRADYIHVKDLDCQWWDHQHKAYREAYESVWQRLEQA